MSNIAALLKHEISRISRREVRSLTHSLHKASAQFRRDIAALKRMSSKVQAELRRIERSKAGVLHLKANGVDADKLRFSVRSVKSQRRRLGVSAEAFGKLVGVSTATVYSWEHGTSKPRRSQVQSLAAVRALGKKEARERLEQLEAKPLSSSRPARSRSKT